MCVMYVCVQQCVHKYVLMVVRSQHLLSPSIAFHTIVSLLRSLTGAGAH